MTLGEKRRYRPTPEEDQEIREAALDRTIESSFPASDPPSWNSSEAVPGPPPKKGKKGGHGKGA